MKVVSLVLALLMVSGVAFAGGHHHGPDVAEQCGYVDKYSEYQVKNSWLELGLGLDTIVYRFDEGLSEFGLDTIEIQQRWNQSDSRYAGYAVVKTDATKVVSNVLSFLGIK